jgi:hypothetical protein
MKKLLAVVGMMLAANLTAQACDCVSPPVDKAFEKAAAVFVGTVQQVKREEQSAINIVTLTVEQAWKGIAADQKTVTVQTASSGKACGYEFQEKVSYLVYAYGEGKSLRTGECSRTKPLANAEEDLVFLTGDAATAKKIRSTAVPPPAPAPQAPTPAPPGLTVSLQDNGQAVAAVHTSGKTIWQVKLPAPASAVQVEGNRVIVQPSGLVLDLASGKAVQQPTPDLSPDQEATPRKLAEAWAEAWAQANGKTDWGKITKIEDRGTHWLVLFTKFFNKGPASHTAGVSIEKKTGRVQELLGE